MTLITSQKKSIMPRFSIRLEIIPANSVQARLEKAKAYGFDAIAFPGRFQDRFLAEALSLGPERALPIHSVSLGFEGALTASDPERRQACQLSLMKMLTVTANLGGSYFNMPPELLQDNPPSSLTHLNHEQAQAQKDTWLKESIGKVLEHAQTLGIKLLLEPVNRYETDYLIQTAHVVKLCERINHSALGCTLDFYHMQLEELRPELAIRSAQKFLQLIHVADNTRVEPGPGTLNFLPGFKALKAIGYNGVIEVECRSLSGDADVVLPRSLAYLKQLWAEA